MANDSTMTSNRTTTEIRRGDGTPELTAPSSAARDRKFASRKPSNKMRSAETRRGR
jgi:hypothetical protein